MLVGLSVSAIDYKISVTEQCAATYSDQLQLNFRQIRFHRNRPSLNTLLFIPLQPLVVCLVKCDLSLLYETLCRAVNEPAFSE